MMEQNHSTMLLIHSRIGSGILLALSSHLSSARSFLNMPPFFSASLSTMG